MYFVLNRDVLLKPLQKICTVVLSSQNTTPVLGSILLKVKENYLLLIGSNLESEIIVKVNLFEKCQTGFVTVSARKFFEICRGFSKEAKIFVKKKDKKIFILSDGSYYSLAIIPISTFPFIKKKKYVARFFLSSEKFRDLINSTKFSMAYQDSRQYLNGLFLKVEERKVYSISTDGHRLTLHSTLVDKIYSSYSVIIPRKSVLELTRILHDQNGISRITMGETNISVSTENLIFTSRVIGESYPDYKKVLPKKSNKLLEVKLDILRKALNRAAILTDKKSKGVKFYLSLHHMKIVANNLEREEAQETVKIDRYQGDNIEISFNVDYILDFLNILKCKKVRFSLFDAESSVQIEDCENQELIYIVMPMKL